ncbi:hypothetical protein R70006_06180 [Paraburkholderia domus]|uniref:hypothetical protein n=1 Tax=Paraburkholderia domus TaxID=2793075 RepID=UPI001911A703|nr:hypothetical protein [Paraburkholderia domus]MBK5052814.1 hypothetical protein [Burkholderia sp. R-70006]CAE6820626.1 hypothetical protein R70006_06180 [Paraburkholderia domus]
MSYDERDAAMDEMYARISDELYPEHREQAVGEFTAERLRSFYLDNPMVMRPAVEVLQEVKRLHANGHSEAVVVFCATAIELFLKATVLQPIVYGLVHSPALAAVLVKHAVGQAGFARYRDLLSRMFRELADLDLSGVARAGATVSLIDEGGLVQSLRNDIIHKGQRCSLDEANDAIEVTVAVYNEIVLPILASLGLTVVGKGRIEPS